MQTLKKIKANASYTYTKMSDDVPPQHRRHNDDTKVAETCAFDDAEPDDAPECSWPSTEVEPPAAQKWHLGQQKEQTPNTQSNKSMSITTQCQRVQKLCANTEEDQVKRIIRIHRNVQGCATATLPS
jgi:hypothetical protein